MSSPNDVLRYWFGDEPLQPRNKLWWQGGDQLDRDIAARFGQLVERALAGELDHWAETPRGRLALVILLDQFTRNIYRGSGKAFAGDEPALRIVRDGIAAGDDQRLHPLERTFFYLPLEHAESLAAQDEAVARFEQLLSETPEEHRETVAGSLDYARQHHEIIARFGRFPHRNKVLGRESTPAEAAYLDAGGRRFGQ